MSTATLSEFQQNQAAVIAAAQRGPVELVSAGARTHAVLISPEFYADALEALRERSERLSGEGFEQWLRDDVAPAIRAHEANPESGHAFDELEAALGLK